MDTPWSIVCLAGLWGFVGCTTGLILNSFPARGAFDGRRSLGWGAAVVLCFIFWMIGMAKA